MPWPSEPSGYLIPARWQSAWSGATSAGGLVGGVIAGWLIEKIGRKHSFAIGSVLAGVGIGLQVASHEWTVFMGGRIVNAAGFSIVFLTGPVWIGENARPELRGFFLCLLNGCIVLAQFLLACTAQGTSKIQGKWSYELLIVLQFMWVGIMLLGYPIFPESPYWLLKHGRPEKARKSLQWVHGRSDQSLIDAEMKRIQVAVNFSEELKRTTAAKGPEFLQLFQGSNLKRTLIACLPIAAQQFIGAAFVLGYITYFLSLLNVEDYFTVSVVLYVVMLLSNLAAFGLTEIAGRRTLLVPGMFALTAIELLLGIMGCISAKGAIWVILVCIFLWAIIYQITVGAAGFALASEVGSLPLRAATQSIVIVTQLFVGWLIGFISPYMINPDAGNLGAKVGFVFFGFGVPFCILMYFFIPETKGLSYEEMDYLFTTRTNCRHFPRAVATYRSEQGSVVDSDVRDEKGQTFACTGSVSDES